MRLILELVPLLALVTRAQADLPSAELGRKVLEWIHEAEGGYVHPDQEFRVDPESGVTGLFATKMIPKGTVLCQVPWDLIIKSDDPDEEGQMCCGTVKALAREMKRGNESHYAPYINYLESQTVQNVPSAWSPEGKKLLQEVIGGTEDPEIPPTDPTSWVEDDWYGECRGSRADAVAAKAAIMIVQRSDDEILVPGRCYYFFSGVKFDMEFEHSSCSPPFFLVGYDMYNHRNGKYTNSASSIASNKKQVTKASRDISPGEQIHNTYNKCLNCANRKVGYGTAGMRLLVHFFGFVLGCHSTLTCAVLPRVVQKFYVTMDFLSHILEFFIMSITFSLRLMSMTKVNFRLCGCKSLNVRTPFVSYSSNVRYDVLKKSRILTIVMGIRVSPNMNGTRYGNFNKRISRR